MGRGKKAKTFGVYNPNAARGAGGSTFQHCERCDGSYHAALFKTHKCKPKIREYEADPDVEFVSASVPEFTGLPDDEAMLEQKQAAAMAAGNFHELSSGSDTEDETGGGAGAGGGGGAAAPPPRRYRQSSGLNWKRSVPPRRRQPRPWRRLQRRLPRRG